MPKDNIVPASCVVKIKIADMRKYFVLKEQREMENYLIFSLFTWYTVDKVSWTGGENASDQIV